MLAGLMPSMVVIVLSLKVEVVREIPRQAPGILSTSTSSGPVAFWTASARQKRLKTSRIIFNSALL